MDDGKLLLSLVSRDTWLQTMGHHSGPMKLREVFVKLIVMMMMMILFFFLAKVAY